MSQSFILAIDTAYQTCSAALLSEDGKAAFYRTEVVGNKHAERILSMIDELLVEAEAPKTAVKLVAFGAGPGSFTGLRVACGVAQGVAWGLKTDVAAVNSLEADAQAAAAAADLPAGTRIAVMNDARMQEAYCGLYETAGKGERVKSLAASCLVKPADAAKWLEAGKARVFCGSAHAVYKDEMALSADLRELTVPEDMIVTLARLGLADEKSGRTMNPALAAPLYVRDRVALTMEERARGERL